MFMLWLCPWSPLRPRFMRRHEAKVDMNAGAYIMARTADEWLSLRLDVIGATIVLSIALLNIFFRPVHMGVALACSMYSCPGRSE